MKKIYLLCAAVTLCASVVGTLCLKSEKSNFLFEANIEALAQIEESIITCSSGNCGRCFEEITAWPFYKCNWTGMQADYCDCDKVGYM